MVVLQTSKFSRFSEEVKHGAVNGDESGEVYLNHPTFGLLYRVCTLEDRQELFTTLYANRLFFLVTSVPNSIRVEPIGRNDARLMVEDHFRRLRRNGLWEESEKLQTICKQTFQGIA